MAKSAILGSSVAKKYWMAFTGLFLIIFLLGHLIGNLQMIFSDALTFNKYALFMTTNPLVKGLSYLTYFSIIFHAIDGVLLTIENRKARPIRYEVDNAASNSGFAARNMAVLGSVILIFIATHMANFWAKMHFTDMPLYKKEVNIQGQKVSLYVTTDGNYIPVEGLIQSGLVIKNNTQFFDKAANLLVKEGYKDLHKETVDFFKDKKTGLVATLLYVLAMAVLGFHLWHGFASAFQTLGLNHKKYNPVIKITGQLFAVVIPFLFAIIPVYIHFILK